MNANRKLKLVDSNIRRRAAISHALSSSGFHVEPFEDIVMFGGIHCCFSLLVVNRGS